MIKPILILSFLLFCVSCKQTGQSEVETLTVDLTENNPSVHDLFSRAELVPLETNEDCLIKDIKKVVPVKEELYVYDWLRGLLFVYKQNGRFIKVFARKGNAPGEYLGACDVVIDKGVTFLHSMGVIYKYDMQGKFLNQEELPAKPNYQSMVPLGDNQWAMWSCLEKEDDCISILNRSDLSQTGSYWKDDRMLNFSALEPFYQYGGKAYFSVAYRNQVYELTPDSLRLSYQWDFGKDNITEAQLSKYLAIENPNERNRQLFSDLNDGILAYSLEIPNQTDRYYYTALRKEIGMDVPMVHVFYKKQDGTSYVFKNFKEGMSLCPLYMCNDYMISLIRPTECNEYETVLNEKENSMLKSRKEDDNPYLVKLYFK